MPVIFVRLMMEVDQILDDNLWLQLLLQIVLIACNAVFACAEIAVLSVSDLRLARLAEEGNKRAVRLARLTSQPARFLATIQVAITLSGFLGSAFAADNFSDKLVSWIMSLGAGIPEKTLDTISVILITIILSYFTLVFGELVPKRLAMRRAESLALGLSGVITFISRIFKPIVSLLTLSTNGILRLFGIDPNANEEAVTEEEIRMMVDEGSEQGNIDPEERELIKNVFEFDDICASEIATHRMEVSLLWLEEDVSDWEKTIHDSRHTVYPVCSETADNVVGVLNAKDYFRLDDRSRENVLALVRPAWFVPGSVKADVLLRSMKKSRTHFAIVLDTHGGMQGVITITDLIEQVVGDFDDGPGDEEDEDPAIERIDSKTWCVINDPPLDELAEKLGVGLPCGEYDTLGSLVFASLGEVPADGSTPEIDICGIHIRIVSIKGHRLKKAIICMQ